MKATSISHPRYRGLLLLIDQHPRMAQAILNLKPTDRKSLISTTTIAFPEVSKKTPILPAKPAALPPAAKKTLPVPVIDAPKKPAKLRWHHFASSSKEVYNIVKTMGEIDAEGVATLMERPLSGTQKILVALTKKGLVNREMKTRGPGKGNRSFIYSAVEGVEVAEGVVPKNPLPHFKSKQTEALTIVTSPAPNKPVDVLQYVKDSDVTPADFRKQILQDHKDCTEAEVDRLVTEAMNRGDLEVRNNKISVGTARVTRDILNFLGSRPAKVKDIVTALGYRSVATQLGLQTLSLQNKVTVKNGVAALT